MSRKIWAPFTGDIELVKKFKGTEVIGWFGSCPEISPSAREGSVLKTKRKQDFLEGVHEIHRAGMEFAYTYNSIVDLDTTQTMSILEDISALRPDRIIFASPQPLILSADMKPKPEFEISTIAEIVNPSQCEHWAELGATRFTLSTRLSRFPKIIEADFKKYSVKVMVNEICNLNCILRQTHYVNQAQNMVYENYPYKHCQKKMLENYPEQILKNNWILPSQLDNYPENVEFKVVGRTQPSWRIEQWLNYYLTRMDPQDIMDILPYGKAAGDKSEKAGFEPVIAEHPQLLKKKIPQEFFDYFMKTKKPCYPRNCKECGLCSKTAAEYNRK